MMVNELCYFGGCVPYCANYWSSWIPLLVYLWEHVESARLGVVGLEGFGCALWKEVFMLKSVYCVVDLVDVV